MDSGLKDTVSEEAKILDKLGGYDIPEELSIIPVNDMVIYPHTLAPLAIVDKRGTDAVDYAMSQNRMVGAIAIKSKGKTEVSAEDFYEIGSVMVIHKMLKMPDGSMRLIIQGLAKIRVSEYLQKEPFYKAKIEIMPEKEEITERTEALMRAISGRYHKMVELVPYMPDELQVAVMNIEEPIKLAYFTATMVKMKLEERQEILEAEKVEDKLSKVLSVLSRELELLELGGKIQSQVQSEMSKTQREYYLREQLKAIQQELGETDERQAEIKELRTKIEAVNLPDYVLKEVDKELKRFERLPPASAEYTVIRTYLDWLIEIPWNRGTEDNLDLVKAKEVLEADHYDLKEVKERIVEYLAVRKLKDDMRGPILCFVGPPGVGKTSLGQSIARALGRKFIRMSLGGIRDEAEIRGHRRTYVGAMPGRIIQSIRRVESNNPVFMLDEIDKVGTDFRGDPSSALLEVLDPEQNCSFSDHYIDLPFDLSKTMFITTANVLETIQPALRDRMEVLRLSGYTDEEKICIAEKYLIPKQLEDHGLNTENIKFTEEAIRKIIASYTREAGVRNLERQVARVCRKVAHQVAIGKKEPTTVSPDNLYDFLGTEKVFPETAMRTSHPGVATGLAWTEAGGNVLFVEATKMPGKKALSLTGNMGEVMQESAKAALSYIRSQPKKLNIDPEFFEKYDLHLHVPAGAIPKDGPSAGITMATAIASILTERPVRSDIAMTGEITLSGTVLPIGGVKEKVLAAKRAGIKTVILPLRNKNDIGEIDKQLRKGMKFVFVENIDKVLKLALTDKSKKKTKKLTV
ncbi:MAG: endopeptidase La [Deltaproteobacteria bacterium CG_4_9_14_3_um_filter_44_9]|nr:MAG: endopeptidase La [Deltaproteobacteria bacterium CG2_30_43_15]PIU86680.1 MAG: endopeptidase La [Deltaproteobacteria bacterium CG06_land_8_20_14_3_00_44_19]PIX26550.1 MAG: endopeptidase La [Deltaproteobacteria bacterium CG_4_8_14_3_um_filter_43_13]PIZ19600.1 MAG: endopeptidase La [Deltaproteobacteria bacterium CG_4_10_14_0_8_um_filter_43_12]PJB45111.1 MAG: endopeptidase La [Deltaproteobacteria bacterium CG_4_9_14_3_um_filter_44_9]HCX90719.1 endopeptidase La [Deltaproteobacteria bacterium